MNRGERNLLDRKEFWGGKRVLVTGGSGFVGGHLVRKLAELGPRDLFVPFHEKFDLLNEEACVEVVEDQDLVIHLAANVGGIGYNQENPGTLFYENLMMGVLLMHQAMLADVGKFVSVGTVCAYPGETDVPFKEEDLWNGYPEETNAPYGLAKKMLLVQGQAYQKQYGFKAIYLLPVNLYGPGDKFDPAQSHVIPALIKKAVAAKERGKDSIEVWGSGRATREFLYVEDCAEAILLAAERYNGREPVNLGSGMEISIKDLAELICELVGFQGGIEWNTNRPDGQMRRCLDTSRAEREFGFRAKTDFREGLRKTIDWYLQERETRRAF